MAGGYTLTQFGQGNGMVGCRATSLRRPASCAVGFSQTAVPTNTAEEAVGQIFHLMNQFDTPLGSVQDKAAATSRVNTTAASCSRHRISGYGPEQHV